MVVEFAKGKERRGAGDRGDRSGYSRNSFSQKELFLGNLDKGIVSKFETFYKNIHFHLLKKLDVTQHDLTRIFERYGKVIRCDIKNRGNGPVHAFLEYDDERDAKVFEKNQKIKFEIISQLEFKDALNAENGKELLGSSMNVEFAKTKSFGPRDRTDRYAYGRNGFGFGGRSGGGGGGYFDRDRRGGGGGGGRRGDSRDRDYERRRDRSRDRRDRSRDRSRDVRDRDRSDDSRRKNDSKRSLSNESRSKSPRRSRSPSYNKNSGRNSRENDNSHVSME
jgi:hypothetical protein